MRDDGGLDGAGRRDYVAVVTYYLGPSPWDGPDSSLPPHHHQKQRKLKPLGLSSMVVISNRAKIKAPTPMSLVCCLAQGASPLHPSIVWKVLVIQERRIFSEQLRQAQIQPDSPATVSCVCDSFLLCLSWQHAFYSKPQMKSLPASWGPWLLLLFHRGT